MALCKSQGRLLFRQVLTRRGLVKVNRVDVIIGKSGENIKYLQVQSGARIEVNRAEQLINDVLTAARSANAGGSGFISAQAFTNTPTCDDSKVGLIIGKGGEKIKSMQTISGACVQTSTARPLKQEKINVP
ncbi:hypothetical protein HPP92_020012 [Vanilla planifolia]|uniref:K Homology domain-containing protein n=1 Tax=Vanilla planifolia TaxID=51239 RepID=A0A835UJP9_VANPL|nr:hypothetical protein HPP92_020012 [Vanilla planifolia]